MEHLDSRLQWPEELRKEIAVQSLVLEATELVSRLMEEQGLTKAELARRMGKSRAWLTQLLNGSANMTLRTLAEVLVEMDAEARLQARPGAWKTPVPGTKPKPKKPANVSSKEL